MQKLAKSRTGVYEWADANYNFQIGCENNCRYCYARYRMVNRFKKRTAEEWKNPVINQKKVDAPQKYYGRVMFPTTHDITPNNLNEYLCVLRKLLDAGNQVLIVSKPHLECIRVICEAYQEYKSQIMFRFTIGSTSDEVLSFWEPNAPGFDERLESLKLAHEKGFQTSVSCEPFLDVYPVYTYLACKGYITDSFWIGKLNGFNSRIRYSDVSPAQDEKFIEPLAEAQSDWFVKSLHRLLDGQPYIRWKDSIRKVVYG